MIGLCETWLSPDIENSKIEIKGFSEPFRSDCIQSDVHKKGGVCLYFDENLPIIERKDLCLINECIVAEIKLNNNKKYFT